MRQLASRSNATWRQLLALATSAHERRRRKATVIEGVHLVQSYLQRHGVPRLLVVAQGQAHHAEVLALADAVLQVDDARLVGVPDAWFRELSQLNQGVSVAAWVDVPEPPLPECFESDAVYLDRLQDPGNVGSILRTCAAAGVSTVITAPGTAACWSPKVLRAGMGAHFALDIHEAVDGMTVLARARGAVLATTLEAAGSLYRTDLRGPALWLFGNEGAGLDPVLVQAPVTRVAIPQTHGVESLNVASAVAVCLFEQRRQRHA